MNWNDRFLELVRVGRGTFLMGSTNGEPWETPMRHVAIRGGFFIGKYPITFKQWSVVFPDSLFVAENDQLPVHGITWYEAVAFCEKLSKIERESGILPDGLVYRLPTEAEWEFACRAGTDTEFSFGDSIDATLANFDGEPLKEVGQFAPNAWGICDMHGGVSEWCLDSWDGCSGFELADGGAEDSSVLEPYGRSGELKVVRGGSHICDWFDCRSAFRSGAAPNVKAIIGLRIVLGAPICLEDDMLNDARVVSAPEMVPVSGGSVTVGDTSSEVDGSACDFWDLQYDFMIGKYEVSQREWSSLMGWNPSADFGLDKPVENVSWREAVEFCAALTKYERKFGRLAVSEEYRLPTGREWEYCCRAGTNTPFSFGRIANTAFANFSSGHSFLVGSLIANAWGLHDMHGNVAEWCLDAPTSEDAHGQKRLVKGGSFLSLSYDGRSVSRQWCDSSSFRSDLGFRVVRGPSIDLGLEKVESFELISIEFVDVAPGSFLMGSFDDFPISWPPHRVQITKAFSIGMFPVTQAQYQSVMLQNPSQFAARGLADEFSRPVENVSWDDAVTFCKELTALARRSGRIDKSQEYRLPTEAEWEFACWAGHRSQSLASEVLPITRGSSGCPTCPSESQAANSWGIHGMLGNVWEWCLDGWNGPASLNDAACIDPLWRRSGDRVVRGGSWASADSDCVPYRRRKESRSNKSNQLGFRVVLAKTFEPAADLVVPPTLVAIQPGSVKVGGRLGVDGNGVGRLVTIGYGFRIGMFEVTQEEWVSIMGFNPSRFLGPERPVENVRWEDAMEYCRKLTSWFQKSERLDDDFEFRLPTEVEWEYCCRAGAYSAFAFGSSLPVDGANFESSETVDVGKYSPNAWGLYDMHGNVSEWCLDGWDGVGEVLSSDDGGEHCPELVLQHSLSLPYRVFRGGSYDDDMAFCRSDARGCDDLQMLDFLPGFRVVCAPALPLLKDQGF